MNEDSIDALETLKQAMLIEEEGHKFYLKAVQTTQDEEGKEIFRTLAKDEKNHLNLLRKQYTSLKENGIWIEVPKVKRKQAKSDKPLPSKGKKASSKGVTIDPGTVNTLLSSLDIETKSYDLYSRTFSKATDVRAKAAYEFLAMEEIGHFDMLMMRYDYLAGSMGEQS